MVTVGILVHNAGELVRIMIKVNPQDVEVDSSNPKFKVYVPERVHAFYPILLQHTNIILNFFGFQIFTKHRNIMQLR
jgi:hypothetical protein